MDREASILKKNLGDLFPLRVVLCLSFCPRGARIFPCSEKSRTIQNSRHYQFRQGITVFVPLPGTEPAAGLNSRWCEVLTSSGGSLSSHRGTDEYLTPASWRHTLAPGGEFKSQLPVRVSSGGVVALQKAALLTSGPLMASALQTRPLHGTGASHNSRPVAAACASIGKNNSSGAEAYAFTFFLRTTRLISWPNSPIQLIPTPTNT